MRQTDCCFFHACLVFCSQPVYWQNIAGVGLDTLVSAGFFSLFFAQFCCFFAAMFLSDKRSWLAVVLIVHITRPLWL